MLKKVATKIAASTSEIIGYDVIITDETGTIIGASDRKRLGVVHEASIPVIKNKRPLTIRPGYSDHFQGTKPGFTLPIEIHGHIIGTIAITGERRKVEKYGLLVQKHAEIMLREEILMESNLISQQANQEFIKEILAIDANQYSENILRTRSFELGFELKPPFVCAAVEIVNIEELIAGLSKSRNKDESLDVSIQRTKLTILKEIQSIFTTGDLSAYMGDDKFIILHKTGSSPYSQFSAACKYLLERLRAKSIKAIIGIGSSAETILKIKRSNREAWKLIEIGKKQKTAESVLHVDDYHLETIMQSMDPDVMGMMKRKMKELLETDDWEDIAQIIKAWCESGFSKVDTANALHIHRNTLQYRLEKIEEMTGINKKDFRKMLFLYLGISLIEWEFMTK
ncbi:CdaR family transcriptional regulator [Cytobacillus sp. NCCP-133]|uniref:CdaR family transcriptional regulator n=1 Tax=Cytobacillus sp. NCCP-133 TaxID=766848 RepID=UPI00222E55D5|nr:sugar diacid recognition domain-containing protein [Cytobacillus sp. NCCP-133]GLB61824.1 CdaR family transcriptional regulator [Cytobacillus sp. NCCP-133]